MTESQDRPGLAWHKSFYSGSGGGNCVEVARGLCQMNLRDSKNPEHGFLSFAGAEWDAFLASVKATGSSGP
ncbi:DUF397 domain-containing protein [Nocardiopsis ansamitocini]|uniref:DUF397 domain-containing protein n=1 Tax=Nocardiopsis ansamitocini TaxID=1670832 RepID=A0A9W6UGT0_9ACTN|nr:DUF397 domain-containing protein [Nocardiopsis ansamitocini]GLU45947.1 hypothetical protein Nans01_02980 [Nocardiopsis ansamitocini]